MSVGVVYFRQMQSERLCKVIVAPFILNFLDWITTPKKSRLQPINEAKSLLRVRSETVANCHYYQVGLISSLSEKLLNFN